MKLLDYDLFLHIDSLRKSKGIKISDFVDGVCDRRLYSRYQNEEHSMSHKNMIGFLDKLDLSLVEFYYSFYSSEHSEYSKVNKIYTFLASRQLDKAKNLILDLEGYEFDGAQARQFHEYCLIYYNHLTKKDYPEHTLNLLKELIDYDKCIERKILTFIDYASLRLISMIEFDKGVYDTLDMLYERLVVEEQVYVFGDKRDIMPSVYASVGRLYGMQGRYDRLKEVCEKGIQYNITHSTSFLLPSLYYFYSLYFLKTDDMDNALKYARRVIFQCEVENDMHNMNRYKKLLDKDFGFDINGYLAEFKV